METKTSNPKPPRERIPLPGREVEAAAVKAELAVVLANVRGHQDSITEGMENPRRPGLFSPALASDIERLAQKAFDALGLLRRLHDTHGEPFPDRLLEDDPWCAEKCDGVFGVRAKPGRTTVEAELHEICSGLTAEEAESFRKAAWKIRRAADEARKIAAADPENCPKCGARANRIRLDGNNHKRTTDARECQLCGEVTPDGAAKVIQLFPRPE
jgi:hypothetical protein